MKKSAIDLQAGDKIVGGEFASDVANVYTGVVKTTTIVDRGVQIGFEGGGYIVRSEGHIFEVVT